ncbi:MAG: TIGR00282 family metallophosphoesterase [Candidatus Omnitrophica bacterium]|nr:TIGR00282 family metallophosphoesterase [Candidatus Omnitrophota bacterium]MDD5351583.1 TIGR00282 family metallophosphoesterase [Candidatus Omnitrophota bacterium]MDD5551018.1 TIGR00282 family metallophosphoesterase [Candidatus Omnitrophota bacterium]
MKILFIGDVVGSPGRDAVRQILPRIKKDKAVDFVIANAENSAGGTGITSRVANDLFNSGCDVLTSGDHIWRREEVLEVLKSNPRLLRPLNLPSSSVGRGYNVYKTESNIAVGVVCLLGRVFIDALTESPFAVMRNILPDLKKETNIIVVDLHAEATSEKIAMGWFLDGEVSCVLGTHTHVQTADEKILPKGTAYITDVGMAGPFDSVIGRKKEKIIERFLTGMPIRFELGTEDIRLQGVIVEIDEKTGKGISIERVSEKL